MVLSKKELRQFFLLAVRNEGTVPLTITGYTQPSQGSIFRLVNFPTISTATPLVLPVGESRTYDVEFTALDKIQYTDQIVFSEIA